MSSFSTIHLVISCSYRSRAPAINKPLNLSNLLSKRREFPRGRRFRRLMMFGSQMYVREMIRIFGEQIGNANFNNPAAKPDG